MLLLNCILPTKDSLIQEKLREIQLLILNNVNFSRKPNFIFALLLFYRIFAPK